MIPVRSTNRLLLPGLLVVLLAGCRSDRAQDEAVPTSALARAECPVCRREGDLACLQVRVTDDTPTVVLDGEVYYFCSDECRASFERHPDRYRATR